MTESMVVIGKLYCWTCRTSWGSPSWTLPWRAIFWNPSTVYLNRSHQLNVPVIRVVCKTSHDITCNIHTLISLKCNIWLKPRLCCLKESYIGCTGVFAVLLITGVRISALSQNFIPKSVAIHLPQLHPHLPPPPPPPTFGSNQGWGQFRNWNWNWYQFQFQELELQKNWIKGIGIGIDKKELKELIQFPFLIVNSFWFFCYVFQDFSWTTWLI